VLESYLKQAQNTDDKTVALELLTLNFNDSLDLSSQTVTVLVEMSPKIKCTLQPQQTQRASGTEAHDPRASAAQK